MIVVDDEPNDSLITRMKYLYEQDGVFIVIHNIKRLQYNVLDHTLVPQSTILTDDELKDLIERHVKKGSTGEFTLPGLLKIKTVKKPARKARKGVPNPFRPGEVMDVAAKPASTKVKVLPLKALKDFV